MCPHAKSLHVRLAGERLLKQLAAMLWCGDASHEGRTRAGLGTGFVFG